MQKPKRKKPLSDELSPSSIGTNAAAETDNTAPRERIAKRMARAGLCSRREAEAWIAAGRVKLNGKILDTPAITVGPADKIEVDGNVLQERERTRLWLYHKPAGLVTTNRDPEGRKTVFEALPKSLPRVLSIGRLDINTEGLLLLTNDGGLSRVLELPKTGWLRKYRVRAHGSVSQEELDELKNGVAVNGVLYGPIEAQIDREQGSNVWLNISFREGKNREVKEVLGSLGLSVNRLIRISYGPFQLGDLPSGQVREIRSKYLRDQLGEKLVRESGADFDAPVVTRADDIPRSEKKAAEAKPAKEKSASAKFPKGAKHKKTGPGQAAGETLARLSTKKQTTGKTGSRSNKKPFGKSRTRAGKKNADRRR